MSLVSSSQHEETPELNELPVAFPPLGASNEVEIRRYKKKEEVLRQILHSSFSKKDRVNVNSLKEFLSGRIPHNAKLNEDLFNELFQASELDNQNLISMYFDSGI